MSWSRTLKNRQQLRARLEAGEKIGMLFSDIRGFSSYTARQGDRAAYRLSKLHEGLLKETIEEHGGIIVKIMGDGIMAAFPKSQQGIQAATEVQQQIRSRNRQSPQDPIDVGIGLACGTPIMTDLDLIGHSVNLAQRLSSLAKGGQILVTEEVMSSAALQEGLHYLSLGERELKGLESEHIYEVAWMAEVSRLSDAEDHITLVLTERGTVVLELAKKLQDQIAGTLDELESPTKDEGAFSALLQRGIARFTQKIIDKSLGAFGITREQNLDQLELLPQGKDLVVRLGKKELRLRDVDPRAAATFLERLNEIKQRFAKPPDAPEDK